MLPKLACGAIIIPPPSSPDTHIFEALEAMGGQSRGVVGLVRHHQSASRHGEGRGAAVVAWRHSGASAGSAAACKRMGWAPQSRRHSGTQSARSTTKVEGHLGLGGTLPAQQAAHAGRIMAGRLTACPICSWRLGQQAAACTKAGCKQGGGQGHECVHACVLTIWLTYQLN